MQNIKVKEIGEIIEGFAPLDLQEEYDNCGLQVGDPDMDITGILITIDVTSEIIKEAEENSCNLIISHHPVTLSGIKKITPDNLPGGLILDAIKKNIAIYSAHTNIDSIKSGVSGVLAEKLGLINTRILDQRKNLIVKLVTFVPVDNADKVRNALFEAGAGHIGNYDSCSYNLSGFGTFRGNENSNPFVGQPGKIHKEEELRIETIFPVNIQNRVVKSLIEAHPYEEPAFDIYPLNNKSDFYGYGIIGELLEPVHPTEFIKKLKHTTHSGCIRHTEILNTSIQKVAICGGSGSFLIKKAILSGADIFISGDIKYHQFFDAPKTMIICDIGHYESEQFTKELFFKILTKKIPNFAIRLSKINTNPIKYF